MKFSHLGLSTSEAQNLLNTFGPNDITHTQSSSVVRIFISQFTSPLTLLLFAAGLAALYLGDTIEGFFIFLIILLDGIFGFLQEFKAEKALSALKSMTITLARVYRDGQEIELDSRSLVPGDIIVLEEGSIIPADSQILEEKNLEVNESILTGESLSIYKHANDAELSIIYMGTTVVKGRCVAKILHTGLQTKYGAIATKLSEIKEEPTALEKKLSSLTKQLTIIGILGSVLLLAINLQKKSDLFDHILTSISLAVAAVPEGLPAVVTITLAVGVNRMIRHKAIVRKMAVIEALGSTTHIITDKTGTLTKNDMQVKKIWVYNEVFTLPDKPSLQNKQFEQLLETGIYCNTARLVFTHDTHQYSIIGHKTEGCLLILAKETGLSPEHIREDGVLIDEFLFDTSSKTMSVLWKKDQGIHAYVKGAPESILSRCGDILTKEGKKPLSEDLKIVIEKEYQSFAQKGFRVLAFATKPIHESNKKYTRETIESSLIFLGFVGIADPPREEVKESLSLAHQAGIETIMVTGDNELTADAIATEIGLIHKGEKIINGTMLESMSDEELASLLPSIRIFARTTPQQKLRIVQSYQKLGAVVAVTGDGVNDSLAIKQADVGIAMGRTGTDVAREAADLVITDDNYATIVTAIEEGRIIFDNIVKSVLFLIAGNLSEILVVLVGVMIGLPTPLLPVQILWMNVVTDGLPALALAIDQKDPAVMRRKPNTIQRTLLSTNQLKWACWKGILISSISLGIYYLVLVRTTLPFARSVVFTTIIILQMILAFVVRGNTHSWYSNKYLLSAVIVSLLFQAMIIFIPFFHPIFHIGI